MRKVRIDGEIVVEKSSHEKLVANSPTGGWFPASRALTWIVNRRSLFPPHLVFSARLETVSVISSENTEGQPPSIRSIVSAIPTSALRTLHVHHHFPWSFVDRQLSSVVSNCGSSLTTFLSMVPLEAQAVAHLVQLPDLHTLTIASEPPFDLDPPFDPDLPLDPGLHFDGVPLPHVFPPLTTFTIGTAGVAQRWLTLFKLLEASVSAPGGVTPVSRIKKSLRTLNVQDPSCLIDASFASPIQMFRSLVHLNIGARCCAALGCAFKLNDNDIAELTMALHQLEHFSLGEPCARNTCATTVACLLFFSVHCVRLRELTVHFNTTNIVNDFNRVLEGPRFRELRSLPRCPLMDFDAHSMPLLLDEPDFETVVSGMVNIFPSLYKCSGAETGWEELSMKISQFSGA